MYAPAKLFARCALMLFSREIVVQGNTAPNGPVLLVGNHPNGFLDGIVIATRMQRPVYFLGRGDLFGRHFPWVLLKPFHVLPLYSAGRSPRLRTLNEEGLRYCRNVWNNRGVVLVFVEGETIPEWGLREITKTAFRLTEPVWQTGNAEQLHIVAAGIHYDGFRGTDKHILVKIGTATCFGDRTKNSARTASAFSENIRLLLSACLFPDAGAVKTYFTHPSEAVRRRALFLPALAGWLLHAPLYLSAKYIIDASSKREAFRESYLFLFLCIFYPLYWIAVNVSTWVLWRNPRVSGLLLLMPLWARCYILWRKRPG